MRRYRTESVCSYYDNAIGTANESKWAIVRQRLPDILALSNTYKPRSTRTQLLLLIALMHRQTSQLRRLSDLESLSNHAHMPTSVLVNIAGRSRIINLKRIPPEQMIHVDLEGLAFSIPTRQFIIAISDGYAQEAAAKYCPPAITDMLINLSKTKVVDDNIQYRRTLLKRRCGKILFFGLFIFISVMMSTLVISGTKTILKLAAVEHINLGPTITMPFPSRVETDEYWRSR